jgi:MFS family permease
MRNVLVLSVAQALAMSGIPIVVLLGGILGAKLAPNPLLTTLPVAIMVVGVALFTLPAALLMRRIGRKPGFIGGALLAGLAALLAGHAIQIESFALLCMSTFLIGAQGAFIQQYRFAATESVEPAQMGRAVSFVLLGGIVAGFLGPEIAVQASEMIPAKTYLGSFLAMVVLYGLTAIVLSFYKEDSRRTNNTSIAGRSLGQIAEQPDYRLAVFSAVVSYGVMTFVMTATPVHLANAHGYDLGTTSNVLKSHIAAMYIPSLFTGALIDRFGLQRVMTTGVLILLTSAVFGVGASTLPLYYTALILLGLGWNLLFVGATVLLTRTYSQGERFRAQALNDFIVFGAQATASLSAGAVLQLAGWEMVNLAGVVLLIVALGLLIRGRTRIQMNTAHG